MDRAICKQVRMAMAEALAKVAKDFDVDVKVGHMTFNGTSLRATVHVDEHGDGGLPAKYKADWDEAEGMNIVKKEWFGVETFDNGRKFNSVRFKVVGYDFNKPKNCIVLQRQDNGKIYLTGMRHFNNPAFKK